MIYDAYPRLVPFYGPLSWKEPPINDEFDTEDVEKIFSDFSKLDAVYNKNNIDIDKNKALEITKIIIDLTPKNKITSKLIKAITKSKDIDDFIKNLENFFDYINMCVLYQKFYKYFTNNNNKDNNK